jgi:DeoR family transcriptional regulator, fructose operon transcriptional repressor
MNAQKRKQQILKNLEELGEVDIKQLASELNISEITIRRDLNQLSVDGFLYRTHGGAMKVNPLVPPHNFANKAAVNGVAKENICRIAAGEIVAGDVIFMDCGSTVFQLCQFIKHKKIKVITNSIPVVFELQNSQVSVNVAGGEFDPGRQAIHGGMAEYHIKKYRAAKAFVGVDGISSNGLFANSEKEASITLAMAAQSSVTYLLCDAGKIGRESYLKFAGLDLIDVLITDCPLRELKYLKKAGIRLLGTTPARKEGYVRNK